MARTQLKSLTEPMFYVLLALKKVRYGYEIMQYIKSLTDNRVDLGPGTLYALLSRFEDEKYITLVAAESNRRSYIISKKGEELLNKEVLRLNAMISDFNLEKGEKDA